MTNLTATYNSGSTGNNFRPETIVIINCALNAPLMPISIIGNSLVLATILRTPSLRSPSIVFLCSLAVSDLLVGLVVQPVYIGRLFTADFLDKIGDTVAFAACGVSLSTITAISVDRFLALHYHMKYPMLMTTHRAMYISATLWLVNFLMSFLPFWGLDVFYLVIALSIIVCLLLSTVCYIRIYQIVRRHQLQIHVQQQAVESLNAENNQNMHRSMKNAKNTFIYYAVMILCYTPVFISMSILVIMPHHWRRAWNLTDTVAFMNSSINPFLYCWRLRELRTAVSKTVKEVSCKQAEEN
ncbi:melanocyte-stimulating hormone receptor-like [Oculina patagonica]